MTIYNEAKDNTGHTYNKMAAARFIKLADAFPLFQIHTRCISSAIFSTPLSIRKGNKTIIE